MPKLPGTASLGQTLSKQNLIGPMNLAAGEGAPTAYASDRAALASARARMLNADVMLRRELAGDPDHASWGFRYAEGMRAAREEAGSLIRSLPDRIRFDRAAEIDQQRGAAELDRSARKTRFHNDLAMLHQTALASGEETTRIAAIDTAGELIAAAQASGDLDSQRAGELRREWVQSYAAQRMELARLAGSNFSQSDGADSVPIDSGNLMPPEGMDPATDPSVAIGRSILEGSQQTEARPQARTRPAPGQPAPARPAPARPSPGTPSGHRLGDLSSQHESHGDVSSVSSGRNDRGGISYGLYQLTTNGGRVAGFVASTEAGPWASRFRGLRPGTDDFARVWQEIAAEDPTGFGDAQESYVRRTNFDPVVEAVERRTGYDLGTGSTALADVAWSLGVQHGGAATILGDAIETTDRQLGNEQRGTTVYKEALINNIYDRRISYVEGLRQTAIAEHRTGDAQTFASIIRNRYPAERADALRLLRETD